MLVVSPLVALMRSQCGDFNKRGVPAAYVSDIFSESTDKCKMPGSDKANIIFGSPESFIDSHRDLLASSGKRVKALFIDEAHRVLKL